MTDSSSIMRRQLSFGSGGGSRLASRIAPVYSDRLLTVISGRPYLKRIISPCSVTRRPPFRLHGGCDSSAAWAGAPPRPMEPPRPWNNVSSIPAFSQVLINASCAWYCAQKLPSRPHLLLSRNSQSSPSVCPESGRDTSRYSAAGS